MKTTWTREWPQWAMLAAMFGLAIWRWPLTGDHVPVHWDGHGNVNGYGGRIEGLLLLPLASLGMYALLLFLPRLDPGRANYSQFAKSYDLLRTALLLLMFVIYGATLLAMAGYKIEMGYLAALSSGALFIVVGGVLGKMRPTWFVGIRTPWTLSSKTAWVKTHRVGGWTFLGIGLLQIVVALTLGPAYGLNLMPLLLLIAVPGLSVYSYLAWRDADDKMPPAGTLPADNALS
jgi:uncharacterized membrane protein